MKLQEKDVFDLLDEKADFYNSIDFITDDPIQIPHRFSLKQDIEIAGFLSASIAWGNRKSIINDANKMIDLMGNSPYDFVMNFQDSDLQNIPQKAIHRTFNHEDFIFFLKNFRRIYSKFDSLEDAFLLNENETDFYHSIERFRSHFISEKHHGEKHVSSPYKNSASKRLLMFLRWMVRKDKKGVDLGIWENIDARFLSLPLDVHTANISRKLGILSRKQNDWKAVSELDLILRKYKPDDPAIYDFALFGLGVSKEFE